MASPFRRLRARLRPAPLDGPLDLPEGVARVQAVGDVHGRADLLEALLPRLDPDQPRVLLGDYVDRGPDARAVLERLRALDAEPGTTCLMGNHEAMMLAFLDAPDREGPRWMRAGGAATLASFGLDPGAGDWPALAEGLREGLGAGTLGWLRARPAWLRLGGLGLVHAGADPRRPLEDQDPRVPVWGHRDFRSRPRRDGLRIVHGHVVTDRVAWEAGRLDVDTGAWATGRLSAAIVGRDGRATWIHTG